MRLQRFFDGGSLGTSALEQASYDLKAVGSSLTPNSRYREAGEGNAEPPTIL